MHGPGVLPCLVSSSLLHMRLVTGVLQSTGANLGGVGWADTWHVKTTQQGSPRQGPAGLWCLHSDASETGALFILNWKPSQHWPQVSLQAPPLNWSVHEVRSTSGPGGGTQPCLAPYICGTSRSAFCFCCGRESRSVRAACALCSDFQSSDGFMKMFLIFDLFTCIGA